MKRTVVVLMLLVFAATACEAQEVVVGWTIESNTPGSIPATYAAPGVTGVNLSRGPGIHARPDVGAIYHSRGFTTSNDMDPKDYYQWGFTSTHPWDLDLIKVGAKPDFVWGPDDVELRGSFDGGGYVYLGRPPYVGASRLEADLSAFTGVYSVVFRLYGWDSEGTQGNMKIYNRSGPAGARAIQVTGVPEPATLSLLVLGGLPLTRRRRGCHGCGVRSRAR